MSDGLRALLRALVEIGDQEIYTDAWAFKGRVAAMAALVGICRRALQGTRVTVKQVQEAVSIAGLDTRDGDD